MKTFKHIAHAASALVLAVGTATAAADIEDNTVKIGVLADMSGVFSDLSGSGSVTAAEMAAADFVDAVNPDFDVEVLIADHQNSTDIAASQAREWYDVDGVSMITDAINSAVALAVSNVAENRDRMLMVTGSGTTQLSNEQCSPNTIQYTWDTYSLANGLGRTITNAGGKTWYFLTVDYELGQAIERDATAAVERNGGQVVGSITHPLGASDFSSFILQAQSSGADVIGLANAGGDLINAVNAANEFGVAENQTLVGLASTMTDIHAMGLEKAQGMMLVAPFYWDRTDESRAWAKRFHEEEGTMPNMLDAGTYSAVTNYLEAVHELGTDDADTVMEYLRNHEINDMFAQGGRVREDGLMVHDMYLLEVKSPQESEREWDYYNVREVIPGDEAFQPLSESRCPIVTD